MCNIRNIEEEFNFLYNQTEEDKQKLLRLHENALQIYKYSIKERLKNSSVRTYEIFTCDLGENCGVEINKIRPVVVVVGDDGVISRHNVTIVPISHDKDDLYEWQKKIEAEDVQLLDDITLEGVLKTEQIRCVSKARILKRFGKLSDVGISKLKESLKDYLIRE